jgi:hypothetical protein
MNKLETCPECGELLTPIYLDDKSDLIIGFEDCPNNCDKEHMFI